MKAIVAVDKNWAIGCKGQLLDHIPEDLKYFKTMTFEKVVVMGRETFESLPGRKPLKDRINIVLTTRKDFSETDVVVCHSSDELFEKLNSYPKEDIFIIGGEAVYTQLLPFCTEAYITKINKEYEADKYFPNLDRNESWEQVSSSEAHYHNDIEFFFTKYINKEVRG
ncbi:MAG: dihydrofolate reductase [Clostridiales bacterium]|nr:dihydrofolate reductase [Clostridiales bacterium]